MSTEIEPRLATEEEFWALKLAIDEAHFLRRESVGAALGNSLFGVVAKLGDSVVGAGRIVGDGAMYCYIQDVMVDPEYQNNGIGTEIMDNLMAWIDTYMPENIYIGLFTGVDLDSFYARYSFKSSEEFLYGMCTKKRSGVIDLTREGR
ncbi:MAG: GNAT superfamily N-acetyltransferase [Planctomycetota bacterium]|jgi:GNAT superfamily N-acetyltransferase